MTSIQQKRSVVALVEGTNDDLKVVRLDGDRFIITAQQAIDACSLASSAARFQPQFHDLMDTLYSWIERRKAKISSAFVSIGKEGILFLVVQRKIKADFDLEDELVELDLKIATDNKLDLIPFNTLLVPQVSEEVLQSFLSSGTIVSQVNAEQRQPS